MEDVANGDDFKTSLKRRQNGKEDFENPIKRKSNPKPVKQSTTVKGRGRPRKNNNDPLLFN